MTPNSDKPTFLDRSTIIAILIVMGFWLAWSKYMESKYPSQDAGKVAAELNHGSNAASDLSQGATQKSASVADAAKSAAGNGTQLDTNSNQASAAAADVEKFENFSDDRWSFQISSFGMGVKDVDIKGFKTRSNEPIVLGHLAQNYPFSTEMLNETTPSPIKFVLEKTDATTFTGRATMGSLQVVKTVHVHSSDFTLVTDVKVSGVSGNFKGVNTVLSDETQEVPSGGFLSRSYDRQDWYLAHDGNKTRTNITREKPLDQHESNVEVAALSSHYFALAVVDHSDLLPNFESSMQAQATQATGRLAYRPVNLGDSFTVKYVAYAGPKSYSLLNSIDPRLAGAIDYGMFAIIARPLLLLMRFLFSIFSNWGVAIIVMTILVRLVVLPFNIFSMKSMKAMQRIQPEMNRIKERYKDKPSDQKLQMNQEIMDLMKRNKANPLGGCLPMLLQLPVFFALYQVLGQSIELYRAPFMLWIQDLSAKDPFYVLPVLMGITMFVQQRITPTPMDPQQAKVMMWMPVIFSLFMVSLPSGLTLYIFISTLFAIIQQFVLMRDRTHATATVQEAKA